MGLTWIDHDTIDKPVEEITMGTAEAQDIEFTVETLKCNNPAASSASSVSGSLSNMSSISSGSRRESLISKKVSSQSRIQTEIMQEVQY